MSPLFLWPVFGFHDPRRPTVATFFDRRDAEDFVNSNLSECNFYIGEPRYDRRASGYRPQAECKLELGDATAPSSPTEEAGAPNLLTECHGDPLLRKRRAA